MKKLIIVLPLLFCLSVFAEKVSVDKARKVALNFYFEKYNQFEGRIDYDALEISDVFTQKQNQEAAYYVFRFSRGGFVIVAADDCLNPVFGYSFNHDFVVENQPPNVQWWFQQFEDQVNYVRENNRKPEKEASEKWEHYLANDLDSFRGLSRGDEVEPLLTTLWNQGWPYNYYCPETLTGGSGGHVWAGCVATAVSQIAYYWSWPDHGQGYTSYIPTIHPEFGVQSADFENTWYRYNEMVDDPKTVNKAIAEYIYHVAVNLRMDFTPYGSSPDSSMLIPGVDSTAYHFKYFPYTSLYRDSMPDE